MSETRIEHIRSMIAEASVTCQAMADGLWRCERRAINQTPFAVVYVDARNRFAREH